MTDCSCSEEVFWHTITPGWMAAAWQGGKDTPQSTVIGMLEHCSVTSERRGCGAQRNRACSTPTPPDEERMGGNREELWPDKTRVTTGGNGDKHPLDLQHDWGLRRLYSGRGCQFSAAFAVCLNIHKCVRCVQSAAQRSCYCAKHLKNKPVTVWQLLKSLKCYFFALSETFRLHTVSAGKLGVLSHATMKGRAGPAVWWSVLYIKIRSQKLLGINVRSFGAGTIWSSAKALMQ